MKSKVSGNELKKKITSLQFKLRKVKTEKMAIIKEWQENDESVRLEIENKEMVTRHNTILGKLKEIIVCPVCLK